MASNKARAVASHVVNAEKPITSQSAVNRAAKARITLATAQAIFYAVLNGQTVPEWQQA